MGCGRGRIFEPPLCQQCILTKPGPQESRRPPGMVARRVRHTQGEPSGASIRRLCDIQTAVWGGYADCNLPLTGFCGDSRPLHRLTGSVAPAGAARMQDARFAERQDEERMWRELENLKPTQALPEGTMEASQPYGWSSTLLLLRWAGYALEVTPFRLPACAPSCPALVYSTSCGAHSEPAASLHPSPADALLPTQLVPQERQGRRPHPAPPPVSLLVRCMLSLGVGGTQSGRFATGWPRPPYMCVREGPDGCTPSESSAGGTRASTDAMDDRRVCTLASKCPLPD